MRHPSIATLFRYWSDLRGGRPAPKRTEIDPRAIASELRDIFILEGPAGDFRFRLAGSRMVANLGQSITGRAFDEIFAERARLGAMSSLWIASEDGEPVLMGIRNASLAPGLAAREKPDPTRPVWANFRNIGGVPQPERRVPHLGAGELLLLPLEHRNGLGDRLIGALAFFTQPISPPETAQFLDLTGTRMLGRAARPAAGTGLLPAALADSVISRRGHLVLMRGRKDTE